MSFVPTPMSLKDDCCMKNDRCMKNLRRNPSLEGVVLIYTYLCAIDGSFIAPLLYVRFIQWWADYWRMVNMYIVTFRSFRRTYLFLMNERISDEP